MILSNKERTTANSIIYFLSLYLSGLKWESIDPLNFQAFTERRQVTRRRMIASRSMEDLLCSQTKIRNSKSSVTLIPTQDCPASCRVTACQEYSEVWEPPDEETEESSEPVPACKSDQQPARDTCQSESVGQDSGISSTSDSTISYSNKNVIKTQTEDLSKVPWYEAEMPR